MTRSATRFRRVPEDPGAIRHQETGIVRGKVDTLTAPVRAR
ncbi:MAG TPA: hypothetical protein VFV24_00510 [Candidatus Eisenbacteria bacterium]|nr:hypothetical protein [Candidatus Eisenbacteria bacterium]